MSDTCCISRGFLDAIARPGTVKVFTAYYSECDKSIESITNDDFLEAKEIGSSLKMYPVSIIDDTLIINIKENIDNFSIRRYSTLFFGYNDTDEFAFAVKVKNSSEPNYLEMQDYADHYIYLDLRSRDVRCYFELFESTPQPARHLHPTKEIDDPDAEEVMMIDSRDYNDKIANNIGDNSEIIKDSTTDKTYPAFSVSGKVVNSGGSIIDLNDGQDFIKNQDNLNIINNDLITVEDRII